MANIGYFPHNVRVNIDKVGFFYYWKEPWDWMEGEQTMAQAKEEETKELKEEDEVEEAKKQN